MSNKYKCLKELNIIVEKIEYFNDHLIINDKYLLKKRHNEGIKDYLEKINYNYYPKIIGNSDGYYLYSYDLIDDDYLKEKEFVKALISLINRTVREIDCKDKVNDIYSSLVKEIDDKMKYYLNLQDLIEEREYFAPEEYFLINNLSKFYNLLRFSRYKLDNWYNNCNNKYREVLLINNVGLDNFVFGEKSYFIDFSNCKRGIIVSDLAELYRNNVLYLDIDEIFKLCNEEKILTNDEEELFLSLISIVPKISFTKNHYNNTVLVKKVIDYIDKINCFILEEDKKDEKTNKDEFKEENNNIELSSDK